MQTALLTVQIRALWLVKKKGSTRSKSLSRDQRVQIAENGYKWLSKNYIHSVLQCDNAL